MSAIKFRVKCEYDGVEYNGIVVLPGVNVILNNDEGNAFPSVGFDVPSPFVLANHVTSVSVSDGIPAGWLVLNVAAPVDAE